MVDRWAVASLWWTVGIVFEEGSSEERYYGGKKINSMYKTGMLFMHVAYNLHYYRVRNPKNQLLQIDSSTIVGCSL